MKRSLVTSVVLALASMSLALAVLAGVSKAADDFSSGGYSGSTGNAPWASNWIEIGESDGPNAGAVQVQSSSMCAAGSCLTLTPLLGLGNVGARRSIDLGEVTEASLSYHLDFPGGLLVDGQVLAQVSVDGGGWQTLRSHDKGSSGTFEADLPTGSSVGIRFVTSGLSLGASAGIDDVMVTFSTPAPSSTTTTTTTTTMTTTTTIAPAPTTTSTSSTTTTTPTTGPVEERDADIEPGDQGATTTTTTPEERSSGTPSDDPDQPVVVAGGPPTSGHHRVLTDLSPRLGPATSLSLQAQAGLLVGFSIKVEDVGLDLMASAVLGFLFAVLWSRRLQPSAGLEV